MRAKRKILKAKLIEAIEALDAAADRSGEGGRTFELRHEVLEAGLEVHKRMRPYLDEVGEDMRLSIPSTPNKVGEA
jgi:hypothetical protein